MNLKEHIRSVPDFPKPGILFYDISSVLENPVAWKETIRQMTEVVKKYDPDVLVGIESRGFLFSAPLALELDKPFAMARKPGKLPGETISYEYELEYGTDTLHIQKDAIKEGQTVVILDDLLATGGTLAACVDLVHKAGGKVVCTACAIELNFLKGRDKLDVPVETLVAYDE